MNTIDLSEKEKDQEIDNILSKGLIAPKNLWTQLYEIYRVLGLRYIFSNALFSTLAACAVTLGIVVLYPFSASKHLYALLFAVAPLFYVLITSFIETAEKFSGLYELKMVCKYTIEQITAFRVFCYSLLGTCFCTLISIYFTHISSAYRFFKVFSFSICVLFLCSLMSIVIMRKVNWQWRQFITMVIWITLDVIPAWFFGNQWELFLSQIPMAVTLVIAVISFILFLCETKKLMGIRKREVLQYVGY